MTGFTKFLSVPLVKIALVGAGVTSAAFAFGLPIHDPWFDYVLFVAASGIVAGEPEPDCELKGAPFAYLWFYRSTHLLVASATAYFIHKNKWADIGNPSGAKEQP